MLLSGIVVLATCCSLAAGIAETLVNIEKAEVKTTENNGILSPWSVSITPAKPMNKVTMKTPMLAGLTESNLMLRFKGSVEGTALPVYETTVCEALQEEIIGKGLVAAGNPFPGSCPAAKGDYGFRDFVVNTKKIPPGLPDGKLIGDLELYPPGKEPIATVSFEATISHNMLG